MSADIETSLRGPQSYELAQRAVEVMESHGVWPTIRNFELWVHYVGLKTSPLAEEIERLIAAGEPFTESVGEALAARFLPDSKRNGEILDAGDALSRELQSVAVAIESAQKTSAIYGEQLASASETLAGQDVAKAKSVIDDLATATRAVQAQNKQLATQLGETNAELTRLRENLEQVRRDAMTDGLTNLANRKSFDEALEAACTEADANNQPLCLGIIDIDHFKGFNDTWGHQIGDQVLRYVSSVIGRMGAFPRLAARYGGEEFAVIFPAEQTASAHAVLEEIRLEVSSRALKRRSTNEDLGAMTVSSGIALRLPGEPSANLLERADTALYASKHAGRNRTTIAAPPPATAVAA
ncbi:MAG: diguanylate cyclase [Gemmatimonadaceae bacterium]|nr:diguanylate cyclase [Caulobacter sp.]